MDGCTMICLSIHLLRDVWVIASFHQLWIKLLQTFENSFLYELKFLFHLGKYLGVGLLHHMVSVYLLL